MRQILLSVNGIFNQHMESHPLSDWSSEGGLFCFRGVRAVGSTAPTRVDLLADCQHYIGLPADCRCYNDGGQIARATEEVVPYDLGDRASM